MNRINFSWVIWGLIVLVGAWGFTMKEPVSLPQSAGQDIVPVVEAQPEQSPVVKPVVEEEKVKLPETKVEEKEEAKPVVKEEPKMIPQATSCGSDYYRNVDGNCVHRPSSSPSGASAKCRDGSYSYSQNRRGTCSGHGGVASWL